jgi:hypothetical protein
MTTLTSADIADLTYELNDCEIFNDVLAIVGASGSEKLERGCDGGSIDKYGRRSYRIDRPLGIDDPGATGIVELITDRLDRHIEPYALLSVTLQGKSATLIALILDLKISDKLHIEETVSGIDADFIVESVCWEVGEILAAEVGLVEARAGE